MSKINIFLETAGGPKARAALAAFAAPLRADGEDVHLVETAAYQPCDIAAVFGSPKPGAGVRGLRNELYAAHKGVFLVLDSAFLGRSVYRRPPSLRGFLDKLRGKDRSVVFKASHFRVGLNGAFNNTGDFGNAGSPPDRWQQLSRELGLRLEPYRRSGKHILLVGQIPSDASLQGADIIAWMEEMIPALMQRTQRPIVVRPHPGTKPRDLKRIAARIRGNRQVRLDMPPTGTIRDALADCFLCVTFSSSAAVDALLQGVPAVSLSPASMAWPVTGHDLDHLEAPELHAREQWLYDLAYAQWSETEIASGQVWARLKGKAEAYLRGQQDIRAAGLAS